MTLDDLQNYIKNQVEESYHLEYKGAEAFAKTEGKKSDIAKFVSSFANSDGGRIIYGMREDGHLPASINPIDRAEFNKEWLENVINSNISPRILNVKINVITVEEDQGKVVYVVDIPRGDTAHQSNDKKYYRRFNFQAVAMEDSEIKDVINRRIRTNLSLSIAKSEGTLIGNLFDRISDYTEFKVFIQNNGNVVSKYARIWLIFPSNVAYLVKCKTSIQQGNEFQVLFSNEIERSMKFGNTEYVVSTSFAPILPSEFRQVGIIKFHKFFFRQCNTFQVRISSDDNFKEFDFFVDSLITKTIDSTER